MSQIKYKPLFIDGAYVIELNRYPDQRGYFEEIFNVDRYPKEIGISLPKQISCSSSKAGVVRGLHGSQHYKLVTCVCGDVYDVIADVRKDSPTYLKWVRVRLSAANRKQVFIPKGCAHGFYAVEDNSMLIYAQGETYNSTPDLNVSWDDPVLDIQWPHAESVIISEKDSNAKHLGSDQRLLPQPGRKRILVIGSSGKVGGAICNYIDDVRKDMISFGTHLCNSSDGNTMPFDLSRAAGDEEYANEILDICCPHVIVICGAMSSSAQCANDKNKAAAVNVQGPKNIAKHAVKRGIKVVIFSTDYVFNGMKGAAYVEEDSTNPLSEYGRNKAELEKQVHEVCEGGSLIIRTSTLNGYIQTGLGSFYSLREQLKQGKEFCAADVVRTPTYSEDLAEVVIKLIDLDVSGIVNVCGDDEFRLHEYFRLVAKVMGLDPNLVKAIPRKEYQPVNSALSSERRRRLLPKFKCRSVEEAVKDWMKLNSYLP